MAQHEVHHHLGEHEYSYRHLPVGLVVLLVSLTFIAFFVWQKPMLALIFGDVILQRDCFKICVNSAILDNIPSKRIISWDYILLSIQLLTPYNGLRYKVFE